MGPEIGIVKPFRHKAAQASLPFWGVEVVGAMEGVLRKWRTAFSCDYQDVSGTFCLSISEKLQEADAGHLNSGAVKIKPSLNFHLATRVSLSSAAIDAGQLRGGFRVV